MSSPVNYQKEVLKLTGEISSLQDQAFKNLTSSRIQHFLRDQDALLPLPSYEPGDQVLVCKGRLGKSPNKMDTLWTEPHEVLSKTGIDVYTLKDLQHGHILNRVHAKFLKAAPLGDRNLKEVSPSPAQGSI